EAPLGASEDRGAAWGGGGLAAGVQREVCVRGDDADASLAGAPPAERPWWRGIVWLRAGGGASRAAPAGFRGWQRTWLAVPEATSFVAGTCRAERFHADDRVLAEVVDGRGVAGGPGGRGRLGPTARRLRGPPRRSPAPRCPR